MSFSRAAITIASSFECTPTISITRCVWLRAVGRLTWTPFSIPQNAIPVTIHGHPYLVEFDEFGAQSSVGAGRIIDIADETNPLVVSNIRLEVHQPENFAAQAGDPGANNTALQGYAAHYCNVPQRTDPGIVACSMILSGLRVFDIRDPFNPREIAYYNAPSRPAFVISANYAMSSPAFAPERNEIWYSEGRRRLLCSPAHHGAWPGPSATVTPESPFAIVLPLAGVLVVGTWLVYRRQRAISRERR